jgi:hypothetical protein
MTDAPFGRDRVIRPAGVAIAKHDVMSGDNFQGVEGDFGASLFTKRNWAASVSARRLQWGVEGTPRCGPICVHSPIRQLQHGRRVDMRPDKRLGALLSIAMLAIPSVPAVAQVVSFMGAGPVQLGMTVEAAERSMGGKFAPVSEPFSEACYITRRADGRDEAISYVIQNWKIVRIDFAPRHGQQMNMKTTTGIGIESTEADIRRSYKDIIITRAPYDDAESEIEAAKTRAELGITAQQPLPHFSMRVDSPNHERGIIFDTQDSKVTRFSIGFKNALDTIENCL